MLSQHFFFNSALFIFADIAVSQQKRDRADVIKNNENAESEQKGNSLETESEQKGNSLETDASWGKKSIINE